MAKPSGSVRVVMFSLIPAYIESLDRFLKERGHKLVGLVAAPGPRIRRSDEYREVMSFARPGLDVIISNYPNRWADMIRPMKPDIVVSIGSNWKIPSDVLDVPPLGAINAHDSLLPKLRGRNATGWALRTGDPGYGASFHRITSTFDEGPIMAQRPVHIGDYDDVDDILPRLQSAAEDACSEAFDRLLEGSPGVPQDESAATYAGGEFEPEWREVDWNRSEREVFFQIRSWCGFRGVPRGAFGELDGQRLLITKAKRVKEPVGMNGASPGTVLSRSAGQILIQCADGPLRILQWAEAPIR